MATILLLLLFTLLQGLEVVGYNPPTHLQGLEIVGYNPPTHLQGLEIVGYNRPTHLKGLEVVGYNQGCWRNEESMNRGMDRGRGIGIDEAFFCDSCSNLEIDENFQISHKLGIDLAE